MTDISREQTLGLLEEFVKTDTLMKHLLGVEAAMKAYAREVWRE